LGLLLRGVENVEHAVLRRDHRRELGEDQATDSEQVLLALQHAAELRQVGFQPVLLAVLLRRVLEVADHLVDVVLQRRHLAARIDLDRPRQVAGGHGSATSAMARTWVVRFAASWLTFSVRSFHVPAAPGTLAWPPNLPSTPTSRATPVT